MNKQDCKLGMLVAVIQHVTPLARARLKVKRIGKIVGIYDDFVNLLLFDYDLSNLENISLENIELGRPMYKETFRFNEIFKIEKEVKNEWKMKKLCSYIGKLGNKRTAKLYCDLHKCYINREKFIF